jgi:hypothetical protein
MHKRWFEQRTVDELLINVREAITGVLEANLRVPLNA